MSSAQGGTVSIEQWIEAPPERVAAFISDFRNAKEWMVGVESVVPLGDDRYRLTLDSPIGRIEPEVEIVERGPERISWVYASAVAGGGRVDVSPDTNGGCVVSYAGEFHLKVRFLDRAARFVGAERFARKNGERSLSRLKYLLEARRYG
ncbi:MAG TPA: SRPBCC family protein [Myxococcaceae bacterium]|nr:SRPBCC family protein [Myxococcaceae bacterium]